MVIFKHNLLIALGLAAAMPLAIQAQNEHDGHQAHGTSAEQAKAQRDAMTSHHGMDHEKMMQMHQQHMGSGQMDHGAQGKGQPQGHDKESPQHDH